MPNLPQDVIADILSRLPVKCLVRFRCVCKPWDALIFDSQFAKLQLQRSSQTALLSSSSLLLSLNYEDECAATILNIDFPLKRPGRRLQILGSCNGLLCINLNQDDVVLWNPSTRSYNKLPKPRFPSHKCVSCELGYDASNDDYKVLRVFAYYRHFKIEVFTLKTNTWRRIQDLHDTTIHDSSGYVNGAFYWLVSRGWGRDRVYTIISFDLSTETFGEVRPLPNHDDNPLLNNLGGLGGCLCVYRGHSGDDVEISIMKEYNVKAEAACWTKLITIPWGTGPSFFSYMAPLCFSKKNDEILMVVDAMELIVYNFKENTFTKIHDDFDRFQAIVYVESLVSPNGDDGT